MTASDRVVDAAYREHRSALLRFSASMTRDAEAAEDLVQEAFVRLAREVRRSGAPDVPAAWLYRVTGNLTRSWLRRRATQRRVRPVRVADIHQPDRVVIGRERVAACAKALRLLSTTDREVVLMAAWGFSGGEIADRVGRTPPATRVALCRARARLRAHQGAEEIAI